MDLYILGGFAVLALIGIIEIVLLSGLKRKQEGDQTHQYMDAQMEKLRRETAAEMQGTRQEILGYIQSNFQSFGALMAESQKQTSGVQDKRLTELTTQLSERTDVLQRTVNVMLAEIRDTMETRLKGLQEENGKKLDEMRATVDEKLQKTLEDRISQSFRVVSERLEQVYKGLGEMQTLAAGVGDLKKVLSNVKTRGILGEIQLGAILEQILSPEQYDENVKTKRSGNERVEFAVRLPGNGDETVYLPIDSKFPGDTYARLCDAYDAGDAAQVEEAGKALERALKGEAKDIHDKYVEPPYTTDFAILFLPFEGLYAEAVRRGLVETLQRDYKVNIAGPTTMAALLNSLQMGFRTLAIQKHSSEVWNVLGAVKTEFDKFGTVLAQTQNRLAQANQELDKLVGTRTRMIQRKLQTVTALPDEASSGVLGIDTIDTDDIYSTPADGREAGTEQITMGAEEIDG